MTVYENQKYAMIKGWCSSSSDRMPWSCVDGSIGWATLDDAAEGLECPGWTWCTAADGSTAGWRPVQGDSTDRDGWKYGRTLTECDSSSSAKTSFARRIISCVQ